MKEGEGGMYGESNMETNIIICKIDRQWSLLCNSGNSNLELCNNIEGWHGEGGGREVQEKGALGIPMADSC